VLASPAPPDGNEAPSKIRAGENCKPRPAIDMYFHCAGLMQQWHRREPAQVHPAALRLEQHRHGSADIVRLTDATECDRVDPSSS